MKQEVRDDALRELAEAIAEATVATWLATMSIENQDPTKCTEPQRQQASGKADL